MVAYVLSVAVLTFSYSLHMHFCVQKACATCMVRVWKKRVGVALDLDECT